MVSTPAMNAPTYRRTIILVTLYGAVLAGWYGFGALGGAPIIASASQGHSSAILSYLVEV